MASEKVILAINNALQAQEVAADEAEALVSALEAANKEGDTTLMPHVRLRGLTALPQVIATNEALAGKCLVILANSLACPNGTDPLRQAAIEGLAGISARSTSKQADVVSAATDVLLQVSMEGSGFAPEVQRRARAQVDMLATQCPRGVAMKMLHWLSDDREDDTTAQIEAERKLALKMLESNALSKNAAAIQAIQQDDTVIPGYCRRVLTAVSAPQFKRLMPIVVGQYLNVPGENNSFSALAGVLDAVLGKFDNQKSWESFLMMVPAMPKAFRSDSPIEKLVTLLSRKNALDQNQENLALIMKTLVAAIQFSPNAADVASSNKKLVPLVRDTMLVGKFLPPVVAAAAATAAAAAGGGGEGESAAVSSEGDYTLVETSLLALASLVGGTEESVKANISDDLAGQLTQLSAALEDIHAKLVFAVKKEGKTADTECAVAVACLDNIKAIAAKMGGKQAFSASSQIPTASWVNVGRYRVSPSAKGAKSVFQNAVSSAVGSNIRQRD